MKNVLVTGGLGFIGSNWINQNIDKYQILNIDDMRTGSSTKNLTKETLSNPNIACSISSIENLTTFELVHGLKFIPDYVINFAAESHVDRSITDPLAFIKTNVLGTANLLNVVRQTNPNVRFLQVSTDEVFGHLNVGDPEFTEESHYNPRSPYSASKASADHIVRSFHHTYGTNIVITNCCNNMGSFQYEEKLIPKIISNCFENKIIPIYGNGKNIREWIPVQYHNEALTLVLEKGKAGETYCIGSGIEKTNIEIVNFICKYINNNYRLSYNCLDLIKFVEDRKGHDMRYAINSQKIKKELGWKCDINFEEELSSVVNRSFINKYKNFGATHYEIQPKHNN